MQHTGLRVVPSRQPNSKLSQETMRLISQLIDFGRGTSSLRRFRSRRKFSSIAPLFQYLLPRKIRTPSHINMIVDNDTQRPCQWHEHKTRWRTPLVKWVFGPYALVAINLDTSFQALFVHGFVSIPPVSTILGKCLHGSRRILSVETNLSHPLYNRLDIVSVWCSTVDVGATDGGQIRDSTSSRPKKNIVGLDISYPVISRIAGA
jgi:hypothetical protein